jgi:Tol biopolymer transport system component
MTSRNASSDDFDRLVSQWMDSDARVGEPEHLLEGVLSQTSVSRRLPRWALPEWWLPMQLTMPLRAAPRLAPLLLIALLVAAVVAVAWIGSRPRLPDPFGPAANGQVAYLSNGQIYAANPDGSSPVQLTFGGRPAATPTWSRDGTRFAYELISPRPGTDNPTGDGDIVVANADGSNTIRIDREARDPSPASWSPDGRWLVYSKVVGPGDQVFVAAADGSSPPVRIGDLSTINWAPIFSPDGTKITFFIDDRGVGVMNRDGSGQHMLNTTPFSGEDLGGWHPQGDRIVVSAAGTEATDLWILHVDGSAEQHLRVPGRSEVGPSWSPNGDRLAYLSSGDGVSFLLHVADADGGNDRQLPGIYSRINPSWSPDGTRIAVLNDLGSVVRLTLIDPDGKAAAIEIEGVIPAGSVDARRSSPTSWQRVAP